MKRSLLPLLLLFGLLSHVHAADTTAHRWTMKWNGFVNPHLFADSRQVVAGREDMMLFYPQPVVLDNEGADLNATPSVNLLSITARIGLSVAGPEVLGARPRAYIEGDWTGPTNATINTLRLRHAFLSLDWTRQQVLLGQYWHPMVVPEIMPGTCPLNMGAPFHAYARDNQARYTLHFDHWQIFGAALFQLDNQSAGPNNDVYLQPSTQQSTAFLKHSLIPELHLQAQFRTENLMAGAAANLLVLMPRTQHFDAAGQVVKATDRFASASATLFLRYTYRQLDIKAQTLLFDNLYEIATLGGYIEKPMAGTSYLNYDYQPWTFTTLWCDLGRNTGRWRPGLFLGYAWNNDFGLAFSPEDGIYGRGFNIESLFRIQPRLAFMAGHGLSFYAEVEYTSALYGTAVNLPNGQQSYQHNEANRANNTRLMLSAVYAF